MKRVLGGWSLICLCLMLSACGSSPTDRPPLTIPVSLPAFSATPTAISTSGPAQKQVATITTTTALPTIPPGARRITLRGKLYDAAQGPNLPLTDASLEWQFAALDWQNYNGRLAVSDGNYLLPLIIRPDDELFIIARAPGYAPSTTHLQAAQLMQPGARLNFGLIRAGGPVPTLPGSLGPVKLSGIVYNSAHGLAAPIEYAAITVVNNSVVEPIRFHHAFSTATGAFSLTLDLHSTDVLKITIAANGYLSSTFTRSGKDLAQNPRFTVGLRPAP